MKNWIIMIDYNFSIEHLFTNLKSTLKKVSINSLPSQKSPVTRLGRLTYLSMLMDGYPRGDFHCVHIRSLDPETLDLGLQ